MNNVIKTQWQKVPRKHQDVDVDQLKIVDDKYQGRKIQKGKYDDIFGKMKYGQAVSCPSEKAQTIANAMRDWLIRVRKKGKVKAVTYHTKTTGRVWLMEKE